MSFRGLRCRSVVRATRIAIFSSRNYNVSSRWQSSLSMLSSLPEFKTAVAFDKQGNFSQAAPLYQRAHEVLSSSTGVSSELSVHVALQLVKSYIHAAKFTLAEKIINNEPFINKEQLSKDNIMTVIKGQQLRASMFLLKGDPVSAGEAAEMAASLCEAQDSQDIDITVHATSYGLKGLSYLFCGEMNDAEQYLQMAARWSQSSKESAIALNNLGTFSWVRLGQSMAEGSATDYQHFLSRDLLYFSQKSQSGSPILTEQQVLLLNEALNYWEEAIEECTSDKENSSNAQQVAAAMCGANIPLGDISMPTPLLVPENPIGMEVRKIPGVSGGSEESGQEGKGKSDGSDILSLRLKEVHFAMNYSSILCNVAVGRSLRAAHLHKQKAIETNKKEGGNENISSSGDTSDNKSDDKSDKGDKGHEGDTADKGEGEKGDVKEKVRVTETVTVTPKQYEEQMSSEIKTSVEILSSAIKALEAHTASNAADNQGEVDSQASTTDLTIAPALGRALGQLGLLYLHPLRGTHPEPVFAEGLFRAALDKLNGPYAVNDKRFLYERAVITRDYGQLLTKWDKREESGANMKRDAGMIFEMLPAKTGGSDAILTSMILLPSDLYIEN